MTRSAAGGASWGARAVRRSYHRAGYLEDGERAAFASVGQEALDGARILDLAVGGGRTTAFLAPPAREYLGVDISPEMLDQARRRYPDVRYVEGDLGDLSSFGDAAWDVIDVSFNSIAVLTHDQRPRALRELHRMLVPGGDLVLSMLMLEDRPVEAPSRSELAPALTRHGWRHPRQRASLTLNALLGFWHHRRTSRQAAEGDDWAWRPLRAHEFRFLALFSTFPAAVADLRAAGFDLVGSWTPEGVPIPLDAPDLPPGVGYVHFHCRRP